MGKYLFLGMTNPAPGRDDDYNAWYSEHHVGDVVRNVKGYVSGQRYKLVKTAAGTGDAWPDRFGYLALFDIETDDPEAVIAEFNAKAGGPDVPLTDALAPDLALYLFAPITDPITG